MANLKRQSGAFSFGEFVWWIGVIEDRKDPQKMGRLRVRIFGYHSEDLNDMPTDKLPWASIVMPCNSASLSGIGFSPTGIVEGTHVIGFFADGHDAQVPVIFGTLPGIPSAKKGFKDAFGDPNGKYPKYELNEPDCNRLSRNAKISETCVQKRKDDEDKNVTGAFGITWNEKSTEYNAKYPYNHVREFESGHVEEWDDTEGKERYLKYHKSGSFEEIYPDGSRVNKIKKDNYEIIYNDNYVHIKGTCRVTIDGDSHLYVKGNANIEVDGNVREHIHGNYKLNVDGNYDVQINGHHYANSDSHEKRTAPRIDLNP